jgi:predicted alpha/beta hydrolase family esterase
MGSPKIDTRGPSETMSACRGIFSIPLNLRIWEQIWYDFAAYCPPVKDVLFVQGAGTGTHEEWDLKLVESLQRELGAGYEVRYPLMPNEDDPTVATWQPKLEKELATLRKGAIVVGHSVGGTILIDLLAKSPRMITLDAIALIAVPFIGEGGWSSEDIAPRSDLAERLPGAVPIFLYHGEADETVPIAHVELYANAVPGAHVRRLAGRDHQLNNDLSEVASDIRNLGSTR